MFNKKQKENSFSFSKINRVIAVALLLLSATFAFAQPKDNSPYSRIGLGDLVQQQFAVSRGFGSLSAAYQHPYHINVENPASLAFLNATAFEIGLYAKRAVLSNNQGEEETVYSGNLRYMALAFPLQNPVNRELERDKSPFRWGMNLALIPYTQVGYDLQTTLVAPEIDTTVNNFIGEGGTYRFIWGNGFRYKNLAVGVNAGFLFGNITQRSQTSLTEIDNSYDILIDNDYSIGGVHFDLGVQYRHDFKSTNSSGELEPNGKSIVIGAFGNTTRKYNTRAEQFFRGQYITSGGFVDTDTILFVQDAIGEGQLPAEFTIGIMYQKSNKLRVGAEFSSEKWSQFTSPIEETRMEDVFSVALGGEWTPDAKSYNSYAKRMQYRAGFRYGVDPRGVDGDLTYRTITVGLGMPIISKGVQSYLDWGIEFGSFGEEDGLNENFIRLTAGFTLNDRSWFFKRRYN
jgi:hypothetical protein